MSKNAKKLNFSVKLLRPVCRTPIKPVITHKNDSKYNRKTKTMKKMAFYE